MSTISEVFNKKRDFYFEKGVSLEKIKEAENKLGLKFADEYKEYLSEYGGVSCAGHELTGFSVDKYLDVVAATVDNIKKNPNVKERMYVIEETHIDGIVIWQSSSGEIFQSGYKEKPEKVYKSLKEYIETFEDND